MPKETINSMVGPYRVQVGWYPMNTVQVSVNAESHILDSLYQDDHTRNMILQELKKVGIVYEDSVDSKQETRHDPACIVADIIDIMKKIDKTYTGLWATLSRDQCNQVIRAIRKARDRTYGRDE